jgi:microcystin-dependent protein
MPKPVGSTLDMGGNKITNLPITPTAASDAASKSYVDSQAGSPIPTGSITMYGGTTAPSGWLLCLGGTFSSATYPALAAVLGDSFGTHSGTTYYLPDMRMRLPLGLSTGAQSTNYKTVGGSDNSPDDTQSSAPSGREGRFQHSHQHTIDGQASDPSPLAGGSGAGSPVRNAYFGGHAHGGLTGASGVGGTPTSNLGSHPFLTLNFIIKT